jgi:hypothetical protein
MSASSVYSGASAPSVYGGVGGGGGIIGSRASSIHGGAVFPSWSGTTGSAGASASSSLTGYRWVLRCLRRGASPSSLDWESIFFQVRYAVRDPARGYKMTMMRKQTKNVWARDDPGVVLVALAASGLLAAVWALAFGVWFPPDVLLLVVRAWAQLGAAVGLVLGLTRFRREALTRPRTAPLPHMVAPALEWAYVAEVAVNAVRRGGGKCRAGARNTPHTGPPRPPRSISPSSSSYTSGCSSRRPSP